MRFNASDKEKWQFLQGKKINNAMPEQNGTVTVLVIAIIEIYGLTINASEELNILFTDQRTQ